MGLLFEHVCWEGGFASEAGCLLLEERLAVGLELGKKGCWGCRGKIDLSGDLIHSIMSELVCWFLMVVQPFKNDSRSLARRARILYRFVLMCLSKEPVAFAVISLLCQIMRNSADSCS